MRSDGPLRVGVLGCGAVADFGHLPALRDHEGVELAALYDPAPSRAEAAAAKFGATSWHTETEPFFGAGLDAVVICSPAPAHRQNVLDCAQHGLPVLCEKPIATTDEEAAEMIAAMEAAGLPFSIGFVYRFSPVAQQIRAWLREGRIGKPAAMRLHYVWDLHGRYLQAPDGTWSENPTWRGRMLEGGPMVDCGVHQIDLARWWTGAEAVRWEGFGAWAADYEAPDHVWLQMDLDDGVHCAIEMSFSYAHTAREERTEFLYEITGDGGLIRYNRWGWHLEIRHGQGTEVVPGASEKNFPGMVDAWVRALRSGDFSEMPSAQDALIATRIATEATEQAVARRVKPKA